MPPQLPGLEAQEERGCHPGAVQPVRDKFTPPVQTWEESQTSGLCIRARRLRPLVGLSHHWAEKTPMMKGPLKLARNMEGRTKRDNLSIVWTYNTIHSTKYVTPSKRHLAPACTLAVLPRMKCACFTSRRCVRRGAAYRSQPLRAVTGLSILGGHAASGFLIDAGPSLLVISVLALLVAIRPLLLGGRARLRCSVASVLLALSLLVAGVLWGGTLGGSVALLLSGIALLVGVLLLGVRLLLCRALLVSCLLLAVLWVSCRGK